MPLYIDELTEVPDPPTFYSAHVHPRVPVMLRGAQRDAPALHLWGSDDYLASTYVVALHSVALVKKKKPHLPFAENRR